MKDCPVMAASDRRSRKAQVDYGMLECRRPYDAGHAPPSGCPWRAPSNCYLLYSRTVAEFCMAGARPRVAREALNEQDCLRAHVATT